MDRHLELIVGQTEKFSKMLAANLKAGPGKARAGGGDCRLLLECEGTREGREGGASPGVLSSAPVTLVLNPDMACSHALRRARGFVCRRRVVGCAQGL